MQSIIIECVSYMFLNITQTTPLLVCIINIKMGTQILRVEWLIVCLICSHFKQILICFTVVGVTFIRKQLLSKPSILPFFAAKRPTAITF